MTTTNIVIKTSEVWGYFQKHRDELTTTMHCIASNSEFGTEIYLSNHSGCPEFIVCMDSIEIATKVSEANETDCFKVAGEVYDTYLTIAVIRALDEGCDITEEKANSSGLAEESDDRSYTADKEREKQLTDAVLAFMTVVLEKKEPLSLDKLDEDERDSIEELKDQFLECIAREYTLSIRRPMYLEDEDGEDVLENFPYVHIDL